MTLCTEDPQVVIVNPGTSEFLDTSYFDDYKNLSVVGTPSTGTNHIDVSSLIAKGVSVVCLLDNKKSLKDIHASAEFTWLHIMNLTRKFTNAVNATAGWRSNTNELFLRSHELHGKTIGIVGLGRIGTKVAKYAKTFGMKVCFYDPYVTNMSYTSVKSLRQIGDCDIISINCSLTSETMSMIRPGVWDNIKPGTVVVNTSRGEVVDEDYIVTLVKDWGILYGADVLRNEQNIPRLKKSPILVLSKRSDRVVITPHIAGATKESQTKALLTTLDLAKRSLSV
jgi:D-3-phosphoglycerate dehydrogenase